MATALPRVPLRPLRWARETTTAALTSRRTRALRTPLAPLPLGAAGATATIPGAVSDADAILLVLAHYQITYQCAACDALTDLVAALINHDVRHHLVGRDGAPFAPSPTWPDSAIRGQGGHKAVLDRCRKLNAAGLVVFTYDHQAALVGLTSPGLDRAMAIAKHLGMNLPPFYTTE